jgi:DNA-binding XRE family transcriptional regulator
MTLNLTSAQLRAARGLLNWTRALLAKTSGVSEPTIHRMENESVQPQGKSVSKIIQAFNENGIEFTDDGGVKPKRQDVEVLIGRNGHRKFFDTVFEYQQSYGGTIVQMGIDESHFVEIAGSEFSELHKRRMSKLVKERNDIKVLAILREGDTNYEFSEYNQYRWISTDIFSPVPFYIFGKTLAIIDYKTIPAPTIIVHKLPAITEAYRKQFNVFWKLSRKPGSLK